MISSRTSRSVGVSDFVDVDTDLTDQLYLGKFLLPGADEPQRLSLPSSALCRPFGPPPADRAAGLCANRRALPPPARGRRRPDEADLGGVGGKGTGLRRRAASARDRPGRRRRPALAEFVGIRRRALGRLADWSGQPPATRPLPRGGAAHVSRA